MWGGVSEPTSDRWSFWERTVARTVAQWRADRWGDPSYRAVETWVFDYSLLKTSHHLTFNLYAELAWRARERERETYMTERTREERCTASEVVVASVMPRFASRRLWA